MEPLGPVRPVLPGHSLSEELVPALFVLVAHTPPSELLNPALHVRQALTQLTELLTVQHVPPDRTRSQDSQVVLPVRYLMANSSLFKVPIRVYTCPGGVHKLHTL